MNQPTHTLTIITSDNKTVTADIKESSAKAFNDLMNDNTKNYVMEITPRDSESIWINKKDIKSAAVKRIDSDEIEQMHICL